MPESVLVGIDIQPIEEIESSLRSFGVRYRHFLFTDQELESCGDSLATATKLAERFAAKEAVLKILNVTDHVPTWRSIEVKSSVSGGPEIVLHDSAADLAQLQGIRSLSVSFSHAGGVAAAAVVASLVSDTEESVQ
jgi:holo-[acyl-carrier protein] synthase